MNNNEMNRNYFEVYDSLKTKINDIQEFKKTNYEGEEFYPLLIGSYDSVYCYKMKKINNLNKQ